MHVRNFRKMTMHTPAEGAGGGAPPSGPAAGAVAGGDDAVSPADLKAALQHAERSAAARVAALERDVQNERSRRAISDAFSEVNWASPKHRIAAEKLFAAENAGNISVTGDGVAIVKGTAGPQELKSAIKAFADSDQGALFKAGLQPGAGAPRGVSPETMNKSVSEMSRAEFAEFKRQGWTGKITDDEHAPNVTFKQKVNPYAQARDARIAAALNRFNGSGKSAG